MGKIKEILDGFNNKTLTNDEEFARLVDKEESNFVIYKAYNNFKDIASKRPLKATDIISFEQNSHKLIENYGDEDDEDVAYCRMPGNSRKEGCPCILGIATFIKEVKDINKINDTLKKEWDEKERIRNEKYERDKKNYPINYAIELAKLNKHKVPNGCYQQFETWFKIPDSPANMVSVYSDTERCSGSPGYWQWYSIWSEDYKHKKMIEWIKLNQPVKDEETPLKYRGSPEYKGQCCINSVTAESAAKVDRVNQICNQTMNILGPNDTAEAIEIARIEAAEEAEKKAIEEEEKRIAEEEEKRISEEAASKKKTFFLIMVAILLVLLFIGVFAFFYFNSDNVLKTPVIQQPAASVI